MAFSCKVRQAEDLRVLVGLATWRSLMRETFRQRPKEGAPAQLCLGPPAREPVSPSLGVQKILRPPLETFSALAPYSPVTRLTCGPSR